MIDPQWFWTAVALPSYLAFAALCGLVNSIRKRWRTFAHALALVATVASKGEKFYTWLLVSR